MVPNHKGEIPVVILLLPFLLGIGCGLNLFPWADANWLIVAFFVLCFVFIVLNLNYSRFRLYKMRWLGGLLISVMLLLLGWISVIKYSELNNQNHFAKVPAQYLVVKISNEPIAKNGLLRFRADVEESVTNGQKLVATGTLLITIKDSAAKNLNYGDELLVPAKYNAIDPPFNPAEFNYKKYLANKNIFYQAFLYPKQYVVLDRNTGNPLIAHSLRLRRQLVAKLKSNMTDTAAIAVASTLILGYKADLSSDVLEAYSTTGTVYVLSVSGAQVAIIYLVLTFAFKFLDRYRYGKLLRAVLIISIIWYYAMLTGFSLAVCRVSVMVSMVIIGKTFSRYINTLNILAVSAFLLLLYNPFYVAEVGFQLSFIAVSGLILFQSVVYKWLKFKNKWADKLWSLCSVSIAAQVIIFPLSAFYFHQFPVYFLISNLFVIVPAAVIMYSGILYLLLPQIPIVSTVIAFVLEKSIILMNKVLAGIEHMPYASIGKIWLTMPEFLLLFIVVVSLFYFLYNKKTWLLKLCIACFLFLCISISVKAINLSSTKNVTFLNLKKHVGIIFKNGNEAIVLSDIKANDKAYQYSIQPYLDSCGINDMRLFDLNSDVTTTWLVKRDNLIQFLNKRIFIFDGQLQKNNLLAKKIKTNYIYIYGNPYAGLNEINNNFDYQTLVIDGSNSDSFINTVEKQDNSKYVNYKILKRNNSFIIASN
jgi:competence protein ComEC